MRFVAPSWDEIYTKSIRLAKQLRDREKPGFDAIIGVSKGGLALTRILSDLLDIENVLITKCEYYSGIGERRKKPEITQKIHGKIRGKNVLIVDDVVDSGRSLIEIVRHVSSKKPKNLKVATIYIKPWSEVIPDYYISKTDSWIIFPWELHEAMKLLVAENGKDVLSKTHIPSKYIEMLFKMDRNLLQEQRRRQS